MLLNFVAESIDKNSDAEQKVFVTILKKPYIANQKKYKCHNEPSSSSTDWSRFFEKCKYETVIILDGQFVFVCFISDCLDGFRARI